MSAFAREHKRIIRTVTTDDGRTISLNDPVVWREELDRHHANRTELSLDEASDLRLLREHEARLAALERSRPWWSKLLAKVVSAAGRAGR